ncbi:YraN family protein [Thermococcus eurythermalis]|nr:YraN family protein [Thermococcus eurythermalis]
MDNALSLAIEHYVSPEAAMAYDALSTILAPDPTDIVRGGKWGIKILAKDGDEISRFSMGIVKDYLGRKIMVREFTKVSRENARWVVNELGKQYLEEIGEKYVKRRGMDFDEVVDSLKRIRKWLTNKNAFKEVIRRDWDVEKLEEVLNDASSVKHGGRELISKINQELARGQIKSGALYEAEVVSHLKRNGWTIREVEKRVITSIDKNTEIDIIAEKGSETVLIECKRNAHKISEEQLAKYAEYAINRGIRKIEVYYAGGIENIRDYYYYTQYLPKEIKSRFGVDVEVRYLASEFD